MIYSILLFYNIPKIYDIFRCVIQARDELLVPEVLQIKLLEEADARKGANTENYQGAFYVGFEYRKMNLVLKAHQATIRSKNFLS